MTDQAQHIDIPLGTFVAVELLDHAEDSSIPIVFVVVGKLVHVTKTYICVDSWFYAGHKYEYKGIKRTPDPNIKRYTIVRSAIISIRELVFGKELYRNDWLMDSEKKE